MSRFELRLTGSTSSCDGSSPFDFFPVRDDMEEEDVTIPTTTTRTNRKFKKKEREKSFQKCDPREMYRFRKKSTSTSSSSTALLLERKSTTCGLQ